MKKSTVTTRIFCLSLVVSFLLAIGLPITAQADTWKKIQWVTLTEDVTVKKINNRTQHVVSQSVAKSGKYYLLRREKGPNLWVLHSGKYTTNGTYTYAVNRKKNVYYWYAHGKHPTKPANFKFAKFSQFSTSTYRPGYADIYMDGSQKFYSGQPHTKAVFKLTDNLHPLQVKRSATSSTTLDVLFNGKSAQVTPTNKDALSVYPYNSEKLDYESVISQASPYSGKAVLPKGFNMKKITWWDQTGVDADGDDTDAYYRLVHGGWVYID
ncbi:hypothetical protein [Levilactobacillus fujinensis]|uniref:Surface layer protein A domain-containing protein n=1 Tax=Levilactobacillus fujinensis TaxID=2486024 RepID=A0ABW1TDW8_9LACO|nr:hypothetical protein [Levilactobacillus fujinensis]